MATRNHLWMLLFVSLAIAISLSLDYVMDHHNKMTVASKDPAPTKADVDHNSPGIHHRHDS